MPLVLRSIVNTSPVAGVPEGDRPLAGPCESVAQWVLSAAPVTLAEEVLAS